jgi:hypothetical protein
VLLTAARVELRSGGARLGSFDDVVAVVAERSPVTFLDANGQLQEDASQQVPPHITFAKGTAVPALQDWFDKVQAAPKPTAEARAATLVAYDGDNRVAGRFQLKKAFPAALRIASTSTQDRLDVQRLRLVFQAIRQVVS